MTEEERAERKRNAWNPNQFNKGRPGSSNNWKRAAVALACVSDEMTEFLIVLNLVSMPVNKKELVRARNAAMNTHHPDKGGSVEMAKRINDAFEKLSKRLEG